ncbi:MAG: hypothetical protein ABL997_12105 [Planctomycetota bacterium]
MKKLTYIGMFLLAACSSAPSGTNAQAATSTPSCCSAGGCAEGAAPDAKDSKAAAGSCCAEKK